MALEAGTKLGPYEIVDELGKGGMGEVYRATDTRLHRDVAIKVSSETFSDLFQREARAVAALNHPHICHLYDVGPNYLVMELVEGETLADRIQRGPIPLDEALELARQIAAALEAAHEKGITHRDLKPANIKLTPEGSVKVLDFGLAKITEPVSEADIDSQNSPTITQLAASRVGAVMGTAGYMAPEQAKGKKVDKRADIWAFGVVLYEMVTGKRLFQGEDLTETLAAVVLREPDLTAAPPRVRRLLAHCLDKDPKKRLRDIGDAWKLLEEPDVPTVTAPAQPRFGWLPWAVAGVTLVAALVLLVDRWRGPLPEDRPLVRLNLDLPGYTTAGGGFNAAISNDGRRIAYVTAEPDGIPRLATRLLSEPAAHVLTGTEYASRPTFSPDGQWIAFGADVRLKKVSIRGGSPLDLTGAPLFLGASWGRDGFIVASLNVFSGLARLPDSGGEPEPLKGLAGRRITAVQPQILPGGGSVLFGMTPEYVPEIQLLTLATDEVTTLVPGADFARFLPTGGPSRGHLVYLNNGTLFALPFDSVAGKISGPPVPVLEDVGAATASASGDLLYQVGVVPEDWPVSWFRQDGKTEPLLVKPGNYGGPQVSPDGRLLALTVDTERLATRRVMVYDWNSDVSLPLTQPGEGAIGAVWSPDGNYLAYLSRTSPENGHLVWRRADGSGQEHTLLEDSDLAAVNSISPDAKHIAFMKRSAETGVDQWVAPLDLSSPDQPVVGEPEPLVSSPGLDYGAVFSPDGKWIAYGSDHSGQWVVYVQPFPGPGEPREIAAGVWPEWSSNGRQLFLVSPANRILTVDYEVNGYAFVASQPRAWSNTPIRRTLVGLPYYALHPDGQRIVMMPTDEASPDQAGVPHFGFLLNFFDELRRRAPLD